VDSLDETIKDIRSASYALHSRESGIGAPMLRERLLAEVHKVEVSIAVNGDVVLLVIDDGVGLPAQRVESAEDRSRRARRAGQVGMVRPVRALLKDRGH